MLSEELSAWLFETGSFTERLRRFCPHRLKVQLLEQRWARPLPGETKALKLTRQGYVWIREVRLFCDARPWVFARTSIPPSTLRGRCRRLMYLGDRPLGDVLFNDSSLERGEVQVAHIIASHYLYQRALGDCSNRPNALWGRRSVFRSDGRSLLVCEIFLPGLLDFCATNNNVSSS